MRKLIENSIHIPGKITVCWPQYNGKEETLDITEIKSKFNGAYCMNNSTICFVYDREVFVTPYTRKAIRTLENAGIDHKYFYVPFSNGDYPKYEKDEWDRLKMAALEASYRDYEDDCKNWCDRNRISELPESTIENCFRIPRAGVPIKHFYYEDTTYPACNEVCMDCTAINRIGRYQANNGKVVFVYRDGHTYVTKGYGIIDELIAAGYKSGPLFVPFSNGEQITNPYLASLWEKVIKK